MQARKVRVPGASLREGVSGCKLHTFLQRGEECAPEILPQREAQSSKPGNPACPLVGFPKRQEKGLQIGRASQLLQSKMDSHLLLPQSPGREVA